MEPKRATTKQRKSRGKKYRGKKTVTSEETGWDRTGNDESETSGNGTSVGSRPQVILSHDQVRSLLAGTAANEVLVGYETEYLLVNGELVVKEIGPVAVVVEESSAEARGLRKQKSTSLQRVIRKRVKLELRNGD